MVFYPKGIENEGRNNLDLADKVLKKRVVLIWDEISLYTKYWDRAVNTKTKLKT